MSRLIDGIPASMFEDSTSCPLAGKRGASCADAAKPVSAEKERRRRGTCEYLRQRGDSIGGEDRDHFKKTNEVLSTGVVPNLLPSKPVKIGTQGYDIKHCCVSPCSSTLNAALKVVKLTDGIVNPLEMNSVKDVMVDGENSGQVMRDCEEVNGEFGRIVNHSNGYVLSDVNGNVTICDNASQELVTSHCDATGCLKKGIRSKPDRTERIGCRGNRHSRHCRESFNVISCKANECNFDQVLGDSCNNEKRTNLTGRRFNRPFLEHIERISNKVNEDNFDSALNDTCINRNRVDQMGYQDNHQYMESSERVSCTTNEENNASKGSCCDGKSLPFGKREDSVENASNDPGSRLCGMDDSHDGWRRCRTQSLCAVPVIDSLSSLVAELHRVFEGDEVNVEYVEAVMRAYKSEPREWRRYAKFNKYKYTRNLVDAGNDKFNLMILCWGEGHGSSVHDHADAHCFMKMLGGSLTETRYAWPSSERGPSSQEESDQPLTALSKSQLNLNDVCYINDSLGLHRVENSSYSDRAVSLHLYSPPFNACSVFNERTGHQTVSRVTFWSKFGKRDKTNEQTEGNQVQEVEDN